METNQELMILSLLNLYTSYVNMKKKSLESSAKKPFYSQYATKHLKSFKAWNKDRQVGSNNLVTITKTLEPRAVINNDTVTRSASTTNATCSNEISTSTSLLKNQFRENSIDICDDISNTSLGTYLETKHVNSESEAKPTDDKEQTLVEEASVITRKTKSGKQRNPNRKPRVRRWRVRPINLDRCRTGYQRKVFANVKKMDEQQFFEHTRMSKSLFDWLLSFVQSSLRRSRQLIFPEERLVMTLNYLAYGTSFQSLAWKHKVGKSTARQIILDTCGVLWNLLSPIYLSEPSAAQYADIAEEFKNKYYIPNCVGAIDGKKVSIKSPQSKDNSNILILGACDAKYKFSAVSVGNLNDLSDDGVFEVTSAENIIISKKLVLPSNKPLSESFPPFPYYFISDTSFPLQTNIMRPYAESNSDVKKSIFNFKISVGRTITENTFGLLTARFRILLTTLEFLPDSCKTIILACIALHNYIMTNDESNLYCPPSFVDRRNESGVIEEGEWRNELKNNRDKPLPSITSSHRRFRCEAINLRDILANFFASEAVSYEIEIA